MNVAFLSKTGLHSYEMTVIHPSLVSQRDMTDYSLGGRMRGGQVLSGVSVSTRSQCTAHRADKNSAG